MITNIIMYYDCAKLPTSLSCAYAGDDLNKNLYRKTNKNFLSFKLSEN